MRLGSLGLACAIIGPLAAHFTLVAPMTGFVVMALGLLLALVSVVVGIVALVRGGGGAAARGMVPGLLVIAAIALVVTFGGGGAYPRINDITTDSERPPVFVRAPSLPANVGRDMGYPGASFASQQREGYGTIAPATLPQPPAAAFTRVRDTAARMAGWELTREDPETRALEGTARSWLFRFEDDFVIEVRPDDAGGSVVHMRSKSRDGQGDMGVNAARIRAFYAALESAT